MSLVGGAVVFDADGTLLDSLPPHVGFCHSMNAELGASLQLPAIDDIAGCRALSAAPMENFLRKAGFSEPHVAAAIKRYEDSFATMHPVRVFSGVPEMLRRLKVAGLRLAVVSSNTSKNVRTGLANGVAPPAGATAEQATDPGLVVDSDAFEFVWGIDNASRSKAEALAAASKHLGVPSKHFIYVGDTIKDAFSAQQAGLGLFLGANWGGFEDMHAAVGQLNQLYFGHDGPPPGPARFMAGGGLTPVGSVEALEGHITEYFSTL